MNVDNGSYEWLRRWLNSATSFSFSFASITDTLMGPGSLARKLP